MIRSRAFGPLLAFLMTTRWRDFRWRTSRKFWLALANTALLLLAENAAELGLDLGDADGWVQGALVIVTPIIVWLVKNDPSDASTESVPAGDTAGLTRE